MLFTFRDAKLPIHYRNTKIGYIGEGLPKNVSGDEVIIPPMDPSKPSSVEPMEDTDFTEAPAAIFEEVTSNVHGRPCRMLGQL